MFYDAHVSKLSVTFAIFAVRAIVLCDDSAIFLHLRIDQVDFLGVSVIEKNSGEKLPDSDVLFGSLLGLAWKLVNWKQNENHQIPKKVARDVGVQIFCNVIVEPPD